jgi:hypothetical protein
MKEIITLDGLAKLAEMKESERPRNWEILVLDYLIKKKDLIAHFESLLNEKKREYEKAVLLARKMGVIW